MIGPQVASLGGEMAQSPRGAREGTRNRVATASWETVHADPVPVFEPSAAAGADRGSLPRIEKILLPTDFSARSLNAAQQAADLARHFGSMITVLHVIEERKTARPAPRISGWGAVGAAPACRPSQREWIEGHGSAMFEGLQLRRALVRSEDPAATIVECARKEAVDLILMPTCGTGPFRKLILGSVAERVLQDTPCPVWTCAHLEQRVSHVQTRLHRVVCAVDRDSQARRILSWAREVTRKLRAQVTVVHAIPPNERLAAGARWAAELRREAESALHRRLEELGLRADVHVETGEVAAVVGSAVENVDADLLVIGRSTDSASFGALLTNAYSLIRQSHCPVVSV